MTAREKAEELIAQFKLILIDSECNSEAICTLLAKQCAKVAVRNIISANPHSNPFNTEMNSTFDWWFEVYNLLSE